MNRDLIVLNLVGIEAQLRRIERVAATINDPTQFSARVPPMLGEMARSTRSLVDRIEHSEGVKSC